MKALYKALRLLISYLISGVALYLSGYGSLMNNVHPDAAARIFLLSTLILGVIVALIWEMYLKMRDLSRRVEKIEANKEN